MTISDILRRLVAQPGVKVGRPPSEDVVSQAEGDLAVRFPGSYRDYLRSVGWFAVPGKEFFGLGDGIPPYLNVVRVAEMERHSPVPLPVHLLPLRNNGSGDFFCLDLSRSSDDPPVVFWAHTDGPEQEPVQEAENLAAWLQKTIELLSS